MIDDEPVETPQVQKTIKKKKQPKCTSKKEEEVVTISQTVTIPYKGVECVPDCPCENEETGCDNPCMEIKCEIVE
jgi:hypothetical protein